MALFFSEEDIERNEMLKNEYPGRVEDLEYPKEELCRSCVSDPRLRVKCSMFSDKVEYYLETPKETAERHLEIAEQNIAKAKEITNKETPKKKRWGLF